MLYVGVIALVLIVAGREYLLALLGRVLIAAGHDYDRGDWIEAGNISGKVVGIGLLHTQVAQRISPGGRTEIVLLSNSAIFRIPLFVLPGERLRKERPMNEFRGGHV